MKHKQKINKDFFEVIKSVDKSFPELNIKLKIHKNGVTFLNSPLELYNKSISIMLKLIHQIEKSLSLFPDSPIIENLEANHLKMKTALIMLILSRKDMFPKENNETQALD